MFLFYTTIRISLIHPQGIHDQFKWYLNSLILSPHSKANTQVLYVSSNDCFLTLQVSGNGNPKQVTFSVTIYNDRPTFLLSAMRELFDIIRREEVFGLDKNMICNVGHFFFTFKSTATLFLTWGSLFPISLSL